MNEFKIKMKTYSVMSSKIVYTQQRAITFCRNREGKGEVCIDLVSPCGQKFLTQISPFPNLKA